MSLHTLSMISTIDRGFLESVLVGGQDEDKNLEDRSEGRKGIAGKKNLNHIKTSSVGLIAGRALNFNIHNTHFYAILSVHFEICLPTKNPLVHKCFTKFL